MSKILYLSLDAIRAKKESLTIKRNDALMNCDYVKADKILKEIQDLNVIFTEALKK